ncbi:protein phosphatase 2C domain-containing protein [Streptomyces sp. NPDC086010]|uniref:protein phosphatase 2C domain-containing protein n=1 Tax=Streptomyces sp. NPDC086010 TaxID=3365745 RepID=UPI0037CEDCFE
MSQQGEKPAADEDDWWRKLYDDTARDTGPSSAADSLDDRFDSASDALGPGDTGGADHPVTVVPLPDPRLPEAAPLPQRRSPRHAAPTRPERAPGPPPPASAPETPASAPGSPTAAAPPAPPPGAPPVPPVPLRPPTAERAPWETPAGQRGPRTFAAPPPPPAPPAVPDAPEPPARPVVGHVGDRPPTYDAEPAALPPSGPDDLDGTVPDTVLDGARYGTFTLRAASVRGDSARFRGEPRRDALLTARFGAGDAALVLVAVAGGARGADGAHLAAADACRWIGGAVARSHARLSDDIRAGRRGDLKSGLHRLTDRTYGKLRSRAAELGLDPSAYTAGLGCLLLSADPDCRTRVFFGTGRGGLFRLRDGAWQDLDPVLPAMPHTDSALPASGDAAEEEGPAGDRLTMDLQITTPPPPYEEGPPPQPAEPFHFRASVARPGDTLLLCGGGMAEPMRGEPALAAELARRWASEVPPGLPAYLADIQLRTKGYADDRTCAAVWEA